MEFLESCTYNKKELPEPAAPNTIKKIKLLSPGGGEHFEQVDSITVQWSTENIKKINIVLSYNIGKSWEYLAKDISASLLKSELTLPTSNIFAKNCLLKIEDAEDKNIYKISTTTFSITKGLPSIELLSPASEERLIAGQNYQIKWQAEAVTNFDIHLLLGGTVFKTIASAIEGNLYIWKVEDLITHDVKIRITDSTNSAVYDVNDIPFHIESEYIIDLTTHPELQNPGANKIFEDFLLGFFTIKKISETEYKAYSMYCTHNGCLITIKTDQSFACPCHGSQFDATGNVTNGPAERPLNQWRTNYFPAESKIVVYSY